jgi:hypothetical protein
MASKIIGYILAAVGIVIIAFMNILQGILTFIPSKPPYILLIGVALVIVGVVFLMGKKTRQEKEVPVYDKNGKNIVGYRRMK